MRKNYRWVRYRERKAWSDISLKNEITNRYRRNILNNKIIWIIKNSIFVNYFQIIFRVGPTENFYTKDLEFNNEKLDRIY